MISLYLAMVETDEDRDKVVLIYENFYSFMCYTAGQILHNDKYDVEDAVHNAMVKLIENLDLIDLSDMQRAKNLCGIVAKNKAIDHCKLKDNQGISFEDSFCKTLVTDDTTSDIVIKKDTYDIILKELKSLDDKYRDICIMKYIHKLKEREIALLLDIPPKTVSTRIFRGKQILREALRKENIYEL